MIGSISKTFGFGALKRPLNGSRTPEMDPKWSPQLPLIDLSPFPGSWTHLGASRGLRSQKRGPYLAIFGPSLTPPILCGDSWGNFTKNGSNIRPGEFFFGFDPFRWLWGHWLILAWGLFSEYLKHWQMTNGEIETTKLLNLYSKATFVTHCAWNRQGKACNKWFWSLNDNDLAHFCVSLLFFNCDGCNKNHHGSNKIILFYVEWWARRKRWG